MFPCPVFLLSTHLANIVACVPCDRGTRCNICSGYELPKTPCNSSPPWYPRMSILTCYLSDAATTARPYTSVARFVVFYHLPSCLLGTSFVSCFMQPGISWVSIAALARCPFAYVTKQKQQKFVLSSLSGFVLFCFFVPFFFFFCRFFRSCHATGG